MKCTYCAEGLECVPKDLLVLLSEACKDTPCIRVVPTLHKPKVWTQDFKRIVNVLRQIQPVC